MTARRRDSQSELADLLRNAVRHSTDEVAIREKIWNDIKKNMDFYRLLFDSWFNRNVGDYMTAYGPGAKPGNNARRPRKSTREQRTAVLNRARQHMEEKAGEILMMLPMKGGKLLRDCTAKDLREQGGWFLLIAKKLKGVQTVGKTLTEAQLKSLWTQANGKAKAA